MGKGTPAPVDHKYADAARNNEKSIQNCSPT